MSLSSARSQVPLSPYCTHYELVISQGRPQKFREMLPLVMTKSSFSGRDLGRPKDEKRKRPLSKNRPLFSFVDCIARNNIYYLLISLHLYRKALHKTFCSLKWAATIRSHSIHASLTRIHANFRGDKPGTGRKRFWVLSIATKALTESD